EFNFGDYFRCDHLVCTLSSGLCRLAYELKQSRSLTTGDDVTSLDDDHYTHEQEAVYKHRAQSKQEIDFNVGDSLSYIADHWDGYIYGRNCRTNQMGVYPSYKVRDKWNTY
ncbi:unnamed protein product, partial [Enterobius vermicularis]|uniref:GT23 domain-containing protein n=1 Tax=Enterobius vermicularis TaxID=51028 RepID=A0A0N4UU89_ENTVE